MAKVDQSPRSGLNPSGDVGLIYIGWKDNRRVFPLTKGI